MPKPNRWMAEKRYEIVLEVLRREGPTAQIARRHQVSEALIKRWRERFSKVVGLSRRNYYRHVRGVVNDRLRGHGSFPRSYEEFMAGGDVEAAGGLASSCLGVCDPVGEAEDDCGLKILTNGTAQ